MDSSASGSLAVAAGAAADEAGSALRRSNRLLVAALLVTLLLWNVPYGWYVLYPFKLFATWLHETSHGLVMVLTGAGFREMKIFRDTSGLAFPGGGVAPGLQALISSAGYMGTAFFGAGFLLLGRTHRGARAVLGVLGATMALSALLYIPRDENTFGLVAVLAGGLALGVAAWLANEAIAGFLVNFLAAQSCINAVLDIRVLFGTEMYVDGRLHGQSDAHTVADKIGGPYWLWAGLWLLWSFGLFYVAPRWVRLRAVRSEAA